MLGSDGQVLARYFHRVPCAVSSTRQLSIFPKYGKYSYGYQRGSRGNSFDSFLACVIAFYTCISKRICIVFYAEPVTGAVVCRMCLEVQYIPP
jgi:hypothetical protein